MFLKASLWVYNAQTIFPFSGFRILNGVGVLGTNFLIFRFVMLRFLSKFIGCATTYNTTPSPTILQEQSIG